jgi:hypothetical protein
MASVYTYRPTPSVEQFIESSRKENRRSAQAEIQLLLESAIKERLRKRKKKEEYACEKS